MSLTPTISLLGSKKNAVTKSIFRSQDKNQSKSKYSSSRSRSRSRENSNPRIQNSFDHCEKFSPSEKFPKLSKISNKDKKENFLRLKRKSLGNPNTSSQNLFSEITSTTYKGSVSDNSFYYENYDYRTMNQIIDSNSMFSNTMGYGDENESLFNSNSVNPKLSTPENNYTFTTRPASFTLRKDIEYTEDKVERINIMAFQKEDDHGSASSHSGFFEIEIDDTNAEMDYFDECTNYTNYMQNFERDSNFSRKIAEKTEFGQDLQPEYQFEIKAEKELKSNSRSSFDDSEPLEENHRKFILQPNFGSSVVRSDQEGSSDQIKFEKLILVIDLDETLVNSMICEFPDERLYKRFGDYLNEFTLEKDDEEFTGYCVIRPDVPLFFEKIYEYYDIIIYSKADIDYVNEVAKILDPEGKYIKKCYGKDGAMMKQLSKVIPEEDMRRALVIDDQKDVWINQEQKKIIPAKRYIPMNHITNEAKYNRFGVCQGLDGAWWSMYKAYNEQMYFAEDGLSGMTQLNDLSNLLIEIFEEWNSPEKQYYSAEEILEEKKRRTLKGLEISIISEDKKRRDIFEYLAQDLGACIVNEIEADVVCVDVNVSEEKRKELELWQFNGQIRNVVSIYWVIEAFFLYKKPSFSKFNKF